MTSKVGALEALVAATLFGASTPLAKLLVGEMSPWLLAGLLYLGSGVGLTLTRLIRDRRWASVEMPAASWPWLLAAVLFGGLLGPVALMMGLSRVSASTSSLLLNFEAVLTAVIAWLVFRERANWRVGLGMVAIVTGGVILAWAGSPGTGAGWIGSALVTLACLFWAIDNNLTRKVAASDALFIAALKGTIAGVVNTGLALSIGAKLPGVAASMAAMAVGLIGYGFSLVLFVVALRTLGAARTGAYFSTAPFIGAIISMALGEVMAPHFWPGAAFMVLGVWLHLTERPERRAAASRKLLR